MCKKGCNSLWITKIVVPLHRQKTKTSSIEENDTEVLVKVKIEKGFS